MGMEKRYKQRLNTMQSELEMEKAKNESIRNHFDEKEEKIKKEKMNESDKLKAELIEQQLEYLSTVDCLKYHEGIHDEISHKVAVKIHQKEKEKRERKKKEKFVFEKELVEIVKMGFNDIDTIKGLLLQFNGRSESVVQCLIK